MIVGRGRDARLLADRRPILLVGHTDPGREEDLKNEGVDDPILGCKDSRPGRGLGRARAGREYRDWKLQDGATSGRAYNAPKEWMDEPDENLLAVLGWGDTVDPPRRRRQQEHRAAERDVKPTAANQRPELCRRSGLA